MPDYAWMCLNMPEYAGIYVNIPKSTWMSFVLHAPIVIPCLLGYLFRRIFNLKEHEAVFLKRQNLMFSIVAGSNWFVFCFRLKIFLSRILKSFLPSRVQGTGTLGRELWILIYSKNAHYVFKIILKSIVNLKSQIVVNFDAVF